eukprot:scaffold4100_cov372-Prasinococcus_capsulatus_cf.AAC.7
MGGASNPEGTDCCGPWLSTVQTMRSGLSTIATTARRTSAKWSASSAQCVPTLTSAWNASR